MTFDAVGGNGAASGAQVKGNLPAGSVVLGVTVEPLLAWLWIGGLLLGVGSALSFLRRRHGEDVEREANRDDHLAGGAGDRDRTVRRSSRREIRWARRPWRRVRCSGKFAPTLKGTGTGRRHVLTEE